MFKRALFILLFFCFVLHSTSFALVLKVDRLIQILQSSDYNFKERKLLKYIQDNFGVISIDSVNADKIIFHNNFITYNLKNREAYEFYIESIYQNRLLKSDEAQKYLLKASNIAANARDHYLLYTFLSHLAFIQTYDGNAIGAIANFAAAKKEAIILKDAYLQVIIDINISDIYYRYNFYGQSLEDLKEAQSIVALQHLDDPRLENIIYYNKCENYFRMKQRDSLIKYNILLKSSGRLTNKLHTYINRTRYYIYLLNGDYKKAIQIITTLKTDTGYKYETIDKQNLADAWVDAGQPDSAKRIIDLLLTDKAQNNHPEIKYHLYELLGEIAMGKNDSKQAAYNYKLALEQSKDNVSKLIKVGDVSSRLKIDEIEYAYYKQDRKYARERMLLIVIIAFSVLIILVIAMFYRNVRQKRHYEKLLFAAKKEELAYINSHDIRRHLTNILGIIAVLKHSDDKEKEYLNVEHHLFYSAEKLDESIKNISEKLDDDGTE